MCDRADQLREVADALEECATVRDTRRGSIHAEVPLDLHARSIAMLRRVAERKERLDAAVTWPEPRTGKRPGK